jgi:hypothetical protein
MDTSTFPLLYYDMNKEADRLRTYDSWSVSFMKKNDMAAAGFYFMCIGNMVRCLFSVVQVGCWGPGDEPSPKMNAGASLTASPAGTLPETFLSVLTHCRVWL